jgi:hypothetical protein
MTQLIDRTRYWQGFPKMPVPKQEGALDGRVVDLVLAILAFVLGGGVLLLLPTQIDGESIRAITSIRSPAFFPTLGALLMCLVALLLAMRVIKPVSVKTVEHETNDDDGAGNLMRSGSIGILILVYGLLLFVIGMIPASVLFIVCSARVFGYTNFWGIGALAVVIPTLVHFLFEGLLNVLLPTGWVF